MSVELKSWIKSRYWVWPISKIEFRKKLINEILNLDNQVGVPFWCIIVHGGKRCSQWNYFKVEKCMLQHCCPSQDSYKRHEFLSSHDSLLVFSSSFFFLLTLNNRCWWTSLHWPLVPCCNVDHDVLEKKNVREIYSEKIITEWVWNKNLFFSSFRSYHLNTSQYNTKI